MRTRSRPASKAFLRALQESRSRGPNPFEDAARGRDVFAPIPACHDEASCRRHGQCMYLGCKAFKNTPVAKRKRGRPFITEPRPWEVAGISRRTWYRREKGK